MFGSYDGVRDRVMELVTAERAPDDLRTYLKRPGGGQFEGLLDRSSPDCFTDKDFQALRKLSVSALHSAREQLLGSYRDRVVALLKGIREDLDIWDVTPDDYSLVLGPESPASLLWKLIYELQNGARHAGRGVTAGKIMHGKRPRLIPIFDHRVSTALQTPRGHFWEAVWYVMRDPEVRKAISDVQGQVSEAADLSPLRVLDVIVWMSGEMKQDKKQVPLLVGDVPSARCDVERVLDSQTIETAQTLMSANEYSQLAVISDSGALKGAVSWKSIVQARFANEAPTLDGATFHCHQVSLNDELLPVIDTIYKEEFMLVTDDAGKLRGIVTAADLAVQFRDLTGAFFQIGDIESRLRRRIKSSFSAAELHAATGVRSADDMTFGQYLRLLENSSNWKKMGWPQADQAMFLDCLDRVRRVRNKVMHSSGELSEDEKDELLQLFNLMRTLDPSTSPMR